MPSDIKSIISAKFKRELSSKELKSTFLIGENRLKNINIPTDVLDDAIVGCFISDNNWHISKQDELVLCKNGIVSSLKFTEIEGVDLLQSKIMTSKEKENEIIVLKLKDKVISFPVEKSTWGTITGIIQLLLKNQPR